MVFELFKNDFECAEDVAHRLADICCYKQEHLPTGSTISGRVAFLVARKMFDEIHDVVVSQGCRGTVYVDDVTVSGQSANMRLLGEIRKIISRNGYKTKYRKSKSYAPGSAKIVTGAVISGDKLCLPNVRHRNIWMTRRELERTVSGERESLMRKLRGRLQEASQILGPS
jgi:hypothetical protein